MGRNVYLVQSGSPDPVMEDLCKPKREDYMFCNLASKTCLREPG